MLNPPLSLLSDDLFCYIVDHVAQLPYPNKHLSNLSITDKAFTRFCQAHLFKVLYLDYDWGYDDSISGQLERLREILNDKPSFANSVRVVILTIPESDCENRWLFNDLTFITIFQLLSKSSMPPHKLQLSGTGMHEPFVFEDPILIVERLMETFFSQTLTVLHLTHCENVPLTLFFICSRLREIFLDDVEATEESYDKYPDEQCPARELPALDRLYYRNSDSLIKQMITPPPRFHTGVVLWSNLRVLTLCPHQREDMARLQPILDATCNTLEELYLTQPMPGCCSTTNDQLSLAGLVNLRNLSCLHIFALYAIIDGGMPNSAVLRDINLVLSTIPASNNVTSLIFDFAVPGDRPLRGCLEEDWVGLCDQVVRIAGGKHLNLNLDVSFWDKFAYNTPLVEAELCERINEEITSLSDYPNICTHSCLFRDRR